jgi:hypothetical protein
VSLSKREVQEYYGRFYVLGEDFIRGALRVQPVGNLRSPHELTRAERKPRRPVRFRHDEGSRPKDLIGATWASLCLVSDRVIAALEGFSGWTTYAVEISGRDGDEVSGYQGLAISGRCGPIDNSLTPKQLLPPAVPGGEAVEGRIGMLFEHGTWDGSDLFCTEPGSAVHMTEPVRDALVAAKVTNVDLERITEIRRLWD